MTTPLTDEQRDWDLRLNFEAVTKDRDKWMRLFEQAGRDAAAERERADRAEREVADLLAIDPDWPDRPRAVATRWQVRADREKARADALEDVIAKVRALADEGGRSNKHANGYAYVRVVDLAALLPDDTKEADRG